jgi:hypothetical protein
MLGMTSSSLDPALRELAFRVAPAAADLAIVRRAANEVARESGVSRSTQDRRVLRLRMVLYDTRLVLR